jgi:hypothetical protein
VTVTASFDFERAKLLGSVGFRLVMGTETFVPEARVESILLVDTERGDLSLPPKPITKDAKDTSAEGTGATAVNAGIDAAASETSKRPKEAAGEP